MGDIYWFDECPVCKADVTDAMGMPELSGYEGDIVQCLKCKSKFMIFMDLKLMKKGKNV